MVVFIVDDSKALRERLVNLLREIDGVGFIGEAGNAADAIAGIQKIEPSVVILDIQMAGGNGIEVLKTVRQGRRPPVVIMLTNHPYRQYREKCLELGAEYFLDKTREVDRLTEIFNHLVEHLNPAAAGAL